MFSNPGNLHSVRPSSSSSQIIVGNGNLLPITHTGTGSLITTTSPLHLRNVLLSPALIKNLLSVRQLTRDNPVSVEFDALGFSVKDIHTREVILRCDYDGDLYPVSASSSCAPRRPFGGVASVDLWHQRLGHPGAAALHSVSIYFPFDCNKSSAHSCHACRTGKNVRLPFQSSTSCSYFPFQLLHLDVWTSPVVSVSGYQYYLVILDDYSHYVWSFPLRYKSEVVTHLSAFFAYVQTQFQRRILALQTDNGREFDNAAVHSLLTKNGTVMRLSCPYTSQQNGKAERVLRTLNDGVRALMFHASVPAKFWAEALNTSTFLLNRRPCRSTTPSTPHDLLLGTAPDYHALRVFGCLCYPNTESTSRHKLDTRSVACVFFGYSPDHRGYRCYDPVTRRVHTSRHVHFVEDVFPFATRTPVVVPSQPATDDEQVLQFVSPQVARASLLPAGGLPTRTSDGEAQQAFPPASSAAPRVCTPGSSPAVDPSPDGTASSARSTPSSCVVPSSSDSSPSPARSSPMLASPPPVRQMITRAQDGIFKPNPRYAQLASTTAPSADISPLPSSVRTAVKDPNWLSAMQEEFAALISNRTWELVPRPPRANLITGKWIFGHKTRADGSLERYKARWVVRGFNQRPGVDYGETFSPVIKPATIRTVLTLAASRNWPVHQLDVKNAFLHGTLDEEVFCLQPAGFVDPDKPDHVCRLSKSLYGLKQAPRAWFLRFARFITSIGFVATRSDSSLFTYSHGADAAFLLLYVDDIILTASSSGLLQRIVDKLTGEFAMKDLGDLHFFLGIQVTRTPAGFFLSQQHYAEEILERAAMDNCKSAPTPIDTHGKLPAADGPKVADPSAYRSLAGALQYLTITRPELAYTAQQICLHMHDPRECHQALIKRALRYVRGSLAMGLWLTASSSLSLRAYTDADWAGCPDTHRSTSGFCVYLGDAQVSWSSKRQATVSRSSAEAEYRGVTNAVAECIWLRQLLGELLCPVRSATLVYCDNISAVYLSANPVHHRRTKHVELDIHFVRERVALGDIRVLHVPTRQQLADVMTKGLPTNIFHEFRSSLCVSFGDVTTAGGC
jgi:histone deacetylase 1/2